MLVFGSSELSAQAVNSGPQDAPRQGFLFMPTVSYNVTGGDLKERYSNFNALGLSVEYKTKSNFQLSLSYDWYYGQNVKDTTLFDGISGPTGQIIDQNGNFSIYRLEIRGHNISANLAYVIPLNKQHVNSGIYMSLGAGYLQHRIDIISSQLTIPQINGDYEDGYDRLASGLLLKQFVGYQYMPGRSKFHLRAGVEFNQGLTYGRRSWNYSTNSPGTEKRFDSVTSLKLGLIVPVFTKEREDEEFFIQ